jgi:NAD dependent epimerase/dehydratase family enzyme
MAKRIIPIELMEKAKQNNIPAITVYKRVASGMSMEDAVNVKNIRKHFKEEKSNLISFRYEDTKKLASHIKTSGKTSSEFISEAINYYLKHLDKQ